MEWLLLAILSLLLVGGVSVAVLGLRSKRKETVAPSEYFKYVKAKQHKATDATLDAIYENCLTLLNKYRLTGQTQAMRKLIFHLDSIERERAVVKAGVDTYVYEADVRHYIKDIASDVVKIIELENYPREVPAAITERIQATKDLFDVFYVVFTDYTGEVEAQVDKTRRDKDPILFGVFKDDELASIIDRFYFIGDWEDEYCDLTLDRMVTEYKQKEGEDIEHTIKDTSDIDALRKELGPVK